MAKKRKAPSSSQQTSEPKPKLIREVVKVESSSEEEEEEKSEEKSSSAEDETSSEAESSSSSEEEEENSESSKSESLRQLLEPFEKDQIIDLIKQAAKSDPKILDSIVKSADSDPTHRNIFIYGLGYDTTSDQLINAFKPFGEIEDSKLVMDKKTGKAKGYAFIVFKTRSAAKNALKIPQKKIGSRVANCQLKSAGSSSGSGSGATPEGGKWKIFVGNVGPSVNPEKLKSFFRKFGEIEENSMGVDSVTNQFKGFAIITYKSEEGYKKALEEPVKVFDGSQLHCKKFAENHTKSSVNNAVTNGVNYGGFGVNPGIYMNPAGYMMGQNPAIGLAGNAMLAAGYNPASFMGSGLSVQPPIAGGNYAMNGIGSNFMGSGLSVQPPIAGGNYAMNGIGSSFMGSGLSVQPPIAGGNYGMNSIGSSVTGSYGSQAALLGLGPYQNAQTGNNSVATPTVVSRPQGSFVPQTTTFPYLNR